MGLDNEIKNQLSGFDDVEARQWLDKQIKFTKLFHKALSAKELQTATFLGGTTQKGDALPSATMDVINLGNMPVFHGYLNEDDTPITDVSNPLFGKGVFEQIPSIEDPTKAIPVHIPAPIVESEPEPEPAPEP